jgi:hypothetical protein
MLFLKMEKNFNGVIYITINLITLEYYIGKDRYNNPKYLGGGVNFKTYLKLFGKENFKKLVIENCDNLESLKEREEYWLNYFDAKNNLLFYNKTNKSNGSDNGPTKTEKYLNRGKKISEARKGIKHQIHWKRSEESKKLISEKLKGKPKTEEHKRNLSLSKSKQNNVI